MKQNNVFNIKNIKSDILTYFWLKIVKNVLMWNTAFLSRFFKSQGLGPPSSGEVKSPSYGGISPPTPTCGIYYTSIYLATNFYRSILFFSQQKVSRPRATSRTRSQWLGRCAKCSMTRTRRWCASQRTTTALTKAASRSTTARNCWPNFRKKWSTEGRMTRALFRKV